MAYQFNHWMMSSMRQVAVASPRRTKIIQNPTGLETLVAFFPRNGQLGLNPARSVRKRSFVHKRGEKGLKG